MAAFFEYVRNITYYLVFAAVVNMASPGGKYQKYIRLVTGLILVALLLAPLTPLLNGGVPVTKLFAQLVAVPGAQNGQAADGLAASYEALQYETVKEAFEDQLRRQLDALLTQSSYTLLEADFDYAADFSQIDRIAMEVSSKPVLKPFIYIEPVRVSVGGADASANADDEADETARAIKKLVADFYNLSPDNIHVRVIYE